MQHAEPVESWYKQFWPWFIISLPASVVVACMVMIYIAFTNVDSLVTEQYYKDGLAINRKLDMEKNALLLAIEANIFFSKNTDALRVTLRGDFDLEPQSISLLLSHPTDELQDRSLQLTRSGYGEYRTSLGEPLQGRWYLSLLDAEGVSWRLNTEIDLRTSLQTQFDYAEVM